MEEKGEMMEAVVMSGLMGSSDEKRGRERGRREE